MTEHDDTRRVRPSSFAADDPLPSGAAEPVDVAQVRADEALIEALRGSADVRVADPIDDRLAGLLQAWRDDVDAEPIPPLDLDATIAALTPVPAARRTRFPVGPLASAAAVVMIAFIGLGIAANDAAPGDRLFAITKVVNPDRAQSLQAAATVRQKLDEASAALDSGELGRAHEALEQARQELPAVGSDDDKELLENKASELETKIQDATSGGVTSPTSPTQSPAGTATTPPGSPETTPVVPPASPEEPTAPPPTTNPAEPTDDPPTTTTTSGSGGEGTPSEEEAGPGSGELGEELGGDDPDDGSKPADPGEN